jgi:preprotein translocase subunit SecE
MAASTDVAAPRAPLPQRTVKYYRDVMTELRKVTWPERAQIQQATIGIIGIVLFAGAVIALLDVLLQAVLVRGIPSLFSGR